MGESGNPYHSWRFAAGVGGGGGGGGKNRLENEGLHVKVTVKLVSQLL
jgi:hypothetical protein